MRLAGANILITGAASGVGLHAMGSLAGKCARVVGVDRDSEAIAGACATQELDIRPCDVSSAQAVESLAEALTQESALPDVVINNAAILRDQALVSRLGKTIRRHDIGDWQATLDTNLTGTFLVAREFASRWVSEARKGLIINTSSVVRVGNAGQSAYAATKAAIDALTVTWSRELAFYGIRVAGIAYGFAETGMTRRIPKIFLRSLNKRSVVGRFADPDELVAGLRFIIENDYFAGRTLELDGGMRF